MAIQIIKQNDGINTDQPKYRVEIKDNGGYGLGYGDTPRRAYAEAREDYEQYRAADTERFLDESLAQFKREWNRISEADFIERNSKEAQS